MLVLVNGLPLFAKRIVKDLNAFDRRNTYVFTDTYYSLWGKIKFFLFLPFSKVIISFNGVSAPSGSLNWALKFKKKIVMQWQGTDVSLALSRFNDNTIYRKYIDNSIHLTDAVWLKSELDKFINSVKIVPFKHFNMIENKVNYKQISILSYIAKGRESFYGYDELFLAAKNFPEIQFNIIGTDGEGKELLQNIVFHGWIDEFKVNQLMRESPIFIRLTKHDGNSVSVFEALGNGCEVIWSYPNEKSYLATDSNELISVLEDLVLSIRARNFTPNQNNFHFVKDNYNKEVILSNYIKVLNNFSNEK